MGIVLLGGLCEESQLGLYMNLSDRNRVLQFGLQRDPFLWF